MLAAGTSAPGLLSGAPDGPSLSSDTRTVEGFVPRYDDVKSVEEKFGMGSIVRSEGSLYSFESS